MRAIRAITAIALVASIAAGQRLSAGADRVDQLVSREMAARKIPGVAVAVIEHGRTIKKASYGLASVELGVPVTNSTLFHLASTTKEFTGIAIMALIEEGRLKLDGSIRTYLPEVPAAWAQATIRNCLSHTSGLPDAVMADQVNIIPLAGDRESLLKILASMPVIEPGTKAIYNQTELMLLGDIIERVSGKSYKSFIEDQLLRPIGISDMRWGDSWNVIPGRASLYTALEPTPDRSKLRLDASGRAVFSLTGIHSFGSKGEPDWLIPAAGLNANIDFDGYVGERALERQDHSAIVASDDGQALSTAQWCLRPVRTCHACWKPTWTGHHIVRWRRCSLGNDDPRYRPDCYRANEPSGILTAGVGRRNSRLVSSEELNGCCFVNPDMFSLMSEKAAC